MHSLSSVLCFAGLAQSAGCRQPGRGADVLRAWLEVWHRGGQVRTGQGFVPLRWEREQRDTSEGRGLRGREGRGAWGEGGEPFVPWQRRRLKTLLCVPLLARSKPTELPFATKEMHPEKLRVLPQVRTWETPEGGGREKGVKRRRRGWMAPREAAAPLITRQRPLLVLNPTTPSPVCLVPLAQECVLRDMSLPPPSMTAAAQPQHHQQHRGPRVGIVLVHCDENLSKLQGLQCNAEDPEAVLYIFR